LLNPQDRGGIKVSLDVGVCPGTQRCVDQGSDTTPGLAANTYAAVKTAKYAVRDIVIHSSRRQEDASTKRPVSGSTL
jgi:hypothetical protein